MNVLMIINGSAYGWHFTNQTRFRLAASLAKRDGVDVTVFLMGDGVTAAIAGQKTPDGYYNWTACSAPWYATAAPSSAAERAWMPAASPKPPSSRRARRSTMEALTDLVLAADKIVTF